MDDTIRNTVERKGKAKEGTVNEAKNGVANKTNGVANNLRRKKHHSQRDKRGLFDSIQKAHSTEKKGIEEYDKSYK